MKLLLFFLAMAAMAGVAGSEASADGVPLKGKNIYLCKIGCGPLRTQVLRANILKFGGKISTDFSSKCDIFLVDKSCQHKEDQVQEIAEISRKHQDVPVVSSVWLTEVVGKKEWIDFAKDKRFLFDLPLKDQDPESAANSMGEIEFRPSKKQRSGSPDQSPPSDAVDGAANATDARAPTTTEESLPPVAHYRLNEKRPKPVIMGDFRNALVNVVKNPGAHSDVIVCQSSRCLVMYDGFPKAKRHLLVLPKEIILSISDIRRDHLPLLRHMHDIATHVVRELMKQYSALEKFRIGYHCVPSMNQVHLHVISTDFDSECLKNKKHWNSFQPPFFVDSMELQKTIEERGNFKADPRAETVWLKDDLKSHRTAEVLKNIPALKAHLKQCKQPVIGPLYPD